MKLNKLREEMAQSFIDALKEDRIPWEQGWQSQDRPRNAVSDNSYKGINNLWLSYIAGEKGYQDPRWCTFKQAQSQGWKVRKGEKGSKVEFWSLYDTKDKKKITQEEVKKFREQLTDAEFQERIKPVSNVYTVFNAEQIDGIPELNKVKIPFSAEELISQRDVLLKNMNVDFHEGGDRAFYRSADDSITLPFAESFQDAYAYMSTFLHEAGHATGHESRLDRPVRNTFGSPAYAKEELRAEIASAFTGQALGIDGMGKEHLDNHKAYIQSWIKTLEDNPGELYAAIRDAEKISDYLIEKGEFDLDAKMRNLETRRATLDSKEVQVSKSLAYRLADNGMSIFVTEHNRDGREYIRQASSVKNLSVIAGGWKSFHVSPLAFEERESFFPTVECTLQEHPAWEDAIRPDVVTRTYTVSELDAMMKQGLKQDVEFTIQMENQRIKEVLKMGNGSGGLLEFLEKNGYRKEYIENLQKEMDIHAEFMKKIDFENNVPRFVSEHQETLNVLDGSQSTCVINLFGGPGSGKTTCAMSICSELKKLGYSAEYVQEYAKELVYEKNFDLLDGSEMHQFEILQEQMHRVDRLLGGDVDFIVCDAPIVLNGIYNKELTAEYSEMLQDLFHQYQNMSFFIERDVTSYQQEGRMQTFQESVEKDAEIRKMLDSYGISWDSCTHEMLDQIVHKAVEQHQQTVQEADSSLQPALTPENIKILGLYEFHGKEEYVHFRQDGREYLTNGTMVVEDVDMLGDIQGIQHLEHVDAIDSDLLMEKLRIHNPQIVFTEQQLKLMNQSIALEDINVGISEIEILGLYKQDVSKQYVQYLQDGELRLTDVEKIWTDHYSIRELLSRDGTQMNNSLDTQGLITKLDQFLPDCGVQEKLREWNPSSERLYHVPLYDVKEAASIRLAIKGKELNVEAWKNDIGYKVGLAAAEYLDQGMEIQEVIFNHLNDIDAQCLIGDHAYTKNILSSVYSNNTEEYRSLNTILTASQSEDFMKVSEQLAGRLVEDGRIDVYAKTRESNDGKDIRRVVDLKELSVPGHDSASFYVLKTALEEKNPLFPTVQCRLSESSAFEEGKFYTVSEFDAMMEREDQLFCEKKQELIQKYQDFDGVVQAVNEGILPESSIGYLGCHKVDFIIQTENQRIEERQDIGDGDGSLLEFLEKCGYGDRKGTIESLQEEMNTHTEFLSYQEKLHDVWNNLDHPSGIEEQPMHLHEQNNTFHMQGKQGMQGRGAGNGIKGVVPVGR